MIKTKIIIINKQNTQKHFIAGKDKNQKGKNFIRTSCTENG